MPLFPWAAAKDEKGNLIPPVIVDTRLSDWGVRLIHMVRDNGPTKRSWGRLLGACTWGEAERDAAWDIYEARIRAGTIVHQDDADWMAEMKQARSVNKGIGRNSVRDASRKIRHLDIGEGIASALYMIQRLMMLRRGMSLTDMQKHSGLARAVSAVSSPRRPITARFGPNGF
jgi:hypothetical protein